MIDIKNWLLPEDVEHMITLRRTIHRHPEILFDLPVTQKLVLDELGELGIPADTSFAPCCVTGFINPDSPGKTLALRADMDALPVEEKTGLPFSSEVPGKMHACGHDCHTAVLLTVARILKRHEQELPCRIKLIFQPSEEGIESGAKRMRENGVLKDVDAIVGQHCDNELPVGLVNICPGPYMAAGVPISLTFLGKSAHVTLPEQGVDAIAMAMEACRVIPEMAREEAALFPEEDGKPAKHLCGVCTFSGGCTHNIICDRVEVKISFRHFNPVFADHFRTRGLSYLDELGRRFGGKVEADWITSCPAVINDKPMSLRFREICDELLPNRAVWADRRLSSEDFAWFLEEKPGFIFRFGTRNEEKGCVTVAHCSDFKPDEDGMSVGVLAFLAYIMNGVY